jgi:F-type H+-transporting ATPase subunit b
VRRLRLLCAASALALTALIAVPGLTGVATAASKPPSKTARECIDKLESGKEPDDCQKAPSPILPASNEIIWGAISFVILFYVLARFAYPGIKKGMDARADRIRNSLDEAERTRAEAQTILDEYQRQLADARSEAARVIEEARQAADAMRRELMAKAEAEAAEARQRAQADIQASVERATADLRAQMAQLSVEAAEMVVRNTIKDRDTQIQLVEDYINRVGAQGRA